ncbi:MAG: hypothetical protein H7X99_09630 [Saprospiraceae bacterium]|nr:hypothetical protein [Saprospiraceae bacterium]
MKNLIVPYFIGIFLTLSVMSCDLTNTPDIEGTQLQEMCGEWWFRISSGGDLVVPNYFMVTTSNTAANTNTDLLLDDHGTWPCKIKCTVDLSSMTFISQNSISNFYDEDISVNIKEGKILKDAATTTGGNVSDSIYIKFEFADDPGTEYIYAGYKRTGFLEDEH